MMLAACLGRNVFISMSLCLMYTEVRMNLVSCFSVTLFHCLYWPYSYASFTYIVVYSFLYCKAFG